jgi:N-acetylneuraminate synthase
MLERLGMKAWKVASGEVSNPVLFEFLIGTGKPVLLSTGMSPLEEIDAAVKPIQAPLAVMQCTNAYPCPPEKLGLNLIPFFRERYGCAVGLSDHSGTIYPGLAAVTLGAEVLEVHVTLSREAFGPDVPASLTTAELRQLVEGVRFLQRALAQPVDKDAMASEMEPLRQMFTKSVVARLDLPEGTVLAPEHLAVKKPGGGIPASRMAKLIGGRLRRAVKADEALREEDL